MVEIDERANFLTTLALPDLPPAAPGQEMTAADFGMSRVRDSAQIDAGALLAFGKSLSPQNTADVSNSLLFAQLAANAAADRFVAAAEWAKTYSTVLSTLGWNLRQSSAGTPARVELPVDWATIITRAFDGTPGQEQAAVAVEAAEGLPAGGQAVLIWQNNAARPERGNFIVQPSQVTDGDLVSQATQLVYTLIRQPKGFLSWDTYYELTTTTTQWVLNEVIYATVRQQVIDRLGDRPKYYIAAVPL